MRFFYTLALWLLLPYIFLRLLWRARKQPEYLHYIGERFGFYSQLSSKPIIWLHAVSVGETRAAQSLISNLHLTYPHHQILLTHTTPTGRAASEQLYGNSVMRVYLPYDFPFAVNLFLHHFRPKLGILMETEIWFNLIHACHEFGTPLLLLNARMSKKSARGYANFSLLVSETLKKLTAIAAQTTEDAARLTMLGAQNVSIMGNLKYDINPPIAMLNLGKQLRNQFGTSRTIFLAASTREGEEALIFDAFLPFHFSNFLLVIVPRHPQRFTAVAKMLELRNITYQRRSENRHVSDEVQVVLGDTMGEMFAYYVSADFAFIGGSLLPYGGQNLIEACAVGTPALVGMHTYNFAEATRLAIKAGAALQVQNISGLIEQVQLLLEDSNKLSTMHHQCTEFIQVNRGATENALQLIKPLLSDKAAS